MLETIMGYAPMILVAAAVGYMYFRGSLPSPVAAIGDKLLAMYLTSKGIDPDDFQAMLDKLVAQNALEKRIEEARQLQETLALVQKPAN